MRNARWMGTALLLMGSGMWALAGRGKAADDMDVRGQVLKVADLLEQKDLVGAKKQAEAIAKKTELEDVMDLFRLRTKKGMGIGPIPGAIKPDGIDAKLINLGKHAPKPKELEKDAVALAKAAYVTAAIAAIAVNKCTVDKKQGAKDPKEWQKWATDMEKSALELAEVTANKKASDIKTVANRLYSTCTACHTAFRD